MALENFILPSVGLGFKAVWKSWLSWQPWAVPDHSGHDMGQWSYTWSGFPVTAWQYGILNWPLAMVSSHPNYHGILYCYYLPQGGRIYCISPPSVTDGNLMGFRGSWRLLLYNLFEALVYLETGCVSVSSPLTWILSFSVVHRRIEGDELREETSRVLLLFDEGWTWPDTS